MQVQKLAINATQMKDKYYVISQSMTRVDDRWLGWGLGGPTWPSEQRAGPVDVLQCLLVSW